MSGHVPTSALQIVGGLGYVDAEYTELNSELQAAGVSLSNQLPHIPEISANLGIAYGFNLSSGSTLTPRIDWSYRDDVFFDALNQAEIAQESYDIINASFSWKSADESISVVLAGTNLADEDYRLAGNSALREASSYSEAVFARGREWSLGVRYNF